MNRFRHRCIAFLVGLPLAGCAGLPAQEMSDARQAIRVARDAGAQRVAPATLEDAQARLQRAEVALRAGEYREARREASEAAGRAREALAATTLLPMGAPPAPPIQLPVAPAAVPSAPRD
ncbi:MAG: DUF4398 domain-containing protein [Gammaproteobacteria bacterium]